MANERTGPQLHYLPAFLGNRRFNRLAPGDLVSPAAQSVLGPLPLWGGFQHDRVSGVTGKLHRKVMRPAPPTPMNTLLPSCFNQFGWSPGYWRSVALNSAQPTTEQSSAR